MLIAGTNITVENGEPNQIIFIIARSKAHCTTWCGRHEINFRSPQMKFIYNIPLLQERIPREPNAWYVDLGIDLRAEEREYFYILLRDFAVMYSLKKIPDDEQSIERMRFT